MKIEGSLNNGSMVEYTNSELKIKEKEIIQNTAEKEKIRTVNLYNNKVVYNKTEYFTMVCISQSNDRS